LDKFKILNRIKELYQENKNIIETLKNMDQRTYNTTEDILISYDFQAGAYTKGYLNHPRLKNLRDEYCRHLAALIDNLDPFASILEVGVGDATTLGLLLSFMQRKPGKCYGFDISWSRIKYARRFLEELGIHGVELFTGDMFNAPLKDSSIDIVYTSHAIEPNGGREAEALQELYRITNKYLILLEPSYDLADEEGKKRMLNHGYITKLYPTALELGLPVVEYRRFEVSLNPLNPTALMVIRKGGDAKVTQPLCCPITKADISMVRNAYFSEHSLLAYPILDGIPCLLPQNAILATKFLD